MHPTRTTVPWIVTVLAGLWLLLVPDLAAAQSLANVCEGPDCSACNLVDLGNRLIVWLIGVITVLFAALMMVTGFQLVTSGGNQSSLQSAKSKFVNAFIGFLIVLSAWLLIDTLMRGLVGSSGEINGRFFWAEVQCFEQTSVSDIEAIRLNAGQNTPSDCGLGTGGVC